jgi:hypothetical protein
MPKNIFKSLSLKTEPADTIYIRNHLFEVAIAGGRKALATRNSSISVCVVVAHTYWDNEQAAYAVAAWLQRTDQTGSLRSFSTPANSSMLQGYRIPYTERNL